MIFFLFQLTWKLVIRISVRPFVISSCNATTLNMKRNINGGNGGIIDKSEDEEIEVSKDTHLYTQGSGTIAAGD